VEQSRGAECSNVAAAGDSRTPQPAELEHHSAVGSPAAYDYAD